ncbi:unnamed protein product [Aspergillus oryzae RIB40]|uniref:DNA, SC010 n=1 Tax=Aspergillus oryzae (strain ATCC 42149 / RIB 40) TaxID=510516 RepID=Q2TW51_ASPOR|nr:unnamed protein product [Aspergillus oryzae RIB40]BAE66522.1 unnamed protein product [Aspergillus oryzae RIB40]
MYLSKIISISFLAALAGAAATPSNLEARQESSCSQAQSALKQTSQHYKSLADQWNGSAKRAIQQLLSQLNAETANIADICAKLAEAEKSAHESYGGIQVQEYGWLLEGPQKINSKSNMRRTQGFQQPSEENMYPCWNAVHSSFAHGWV